MDASATDKLRKQIQQHHVALKADRAPWEAIWQRVHSLIFSLSRSVIVPNNIVQINLDLYDGSGMSALRTFASGISGNVMPRSQPWFNLRYRDPTRNKAAGVAKFQQDLEDVIYSMLDDSNFYEWAYEFAHEGGWACTAAAFIEPIKETKEIVFTTLPTGTYWIQEDSTGTVDTLFREFDMQSREILKWWGDSLSDDDKRTMEETPYLKRKILHAVRPREKFDPADSGNKNFPFESTYWIQGNMTLLEESGYRQFPYLVWRVERSLIGPWGLGPGINILRDATIQQRVAQDMLDADQRLINPAREVPESLRDEGYLTHPGGINWIPDTQIGKARPVNEAVNRPVGIDREERLRQTVEGHFYVPFFLMQSQNERQMTVPEYMGRAAEQGIILEPLTNRFSSEVMDQLLDLLVQYTSDFGLMPDAPADLSEDDNHGIDVEYIGPLATLQKRYHTMNDMQAFIAAFGAFKQTMPENSPLIDDNVNVDDIVAKLAEANGVQTVLTSQADKDKNRQMRQQAMAMQAQAQVKAQQLQAVGAMKKQPGAPTGTPIGGPQ